MSDVFISYSRQNINFTRQLVNQLEAASVSAWVDLQDIPGSADWLDQINRGIESADNVLFIISPESLKSEICNEELRYARQLNKRIIPVPAP